MKHDKNCTLGLYSQTVLSNYPPTVLLNCTLKTKQLFKSRSNNFRKIKIRIVEKL